ncbi:MAG: diacylglycerol kinase [Treponema sp.]|jgi:diacylglycerol kinase family enzyme|nr:diacylglycerol kinase [Treponema sp.]
MNLLLIAQTLTEICERSLLVPERSLNCTIIVNPAAGGYKIANRWKAHSATLEEYRDKAQKNPKRPMHKFANMLITEGKGSAAKITKLVIEKAEKNPEPFYLIISAGGDGTHCEVMLNLYNAPVNVRSNLAVLRLPMGTGNDGADNSSLAAALELLLNPVKIELASAVQLKPAAAGPAHKNGPFLAFNIMSIGLDAYVTHMTNKMKRKKAGDSYQLWVDLAALFYECHYKVDFFDIVARDQQDAVVQAFREKFLLIAMGVTGNRSYGSQQKILPDFRNICAIKKMPLLRKLAIKKQVAKGTHTNSREPEFLSASKLEINSKRKILAQMDGETFLLRPEDFPITMELTPPSIPVLKNNT